MFTEISKKFAVWMHTNSEELVMVKPGYFASDKWLECGNTGDVAGSKFGICGNDGRPGWVSRHNIRPLKDMAEFEALKAASSIVFKRVLELDALGEEIVSAIDCMYGPKGKKSYISEYILFALNNKTNIWESAHFIDNKNNSGLPRTIVHDQDAEYSSFEAMTEALTDTVRKVQGEEFMDDVDRYLKDCSEKGYCFIFYVD